MFDLDSPEHSYYRWRVFSLAQGDLLPRWRLEPFQMVAGGSLWRPPRAEDVPAPVPVGSSGGGGDAARAPEEARGGGGGTTAAERELTDAQRDEFEDALRKLTPDRGAIRAAMAFALDNADAARDVVETLCEALSLPETPATTKARARARCEGDLLRAVA